MRNLDELKKEVHENAVSKGFWDNKLSDEHCLMLVITELSEAVEADREGNYCYGKISSTQRYTMFPTEESRFKKEFEAFIKDTVEDELSDSFIRLLDLFGAREVYLNGDAFNLEVIEGYSGFYQGKSFTESVYFIVGLISSNSQCIENSEVAPEIMLLEILGFAKYINIDLMWYVEQKMKYNKLRERMHGKKY